MMKLLSPVPLKDGMLNYNKPTQPWQAWFCDLFSIINGGATISNDHFNINPDFHWSRVSGNSPLTTDGDVVEMWSIKSNGMTFSATPTFYSSTISSSNSGSDRYINIDITGINANEFVMYQLLPKKLSKLQSNKVSISGRVRNNTTSNVRFYLYIGFDLDGDGVDDYSVKSRNMILYPGDNEISSTLTCPTINVDNQANIVTLSINLYDIISVVNLDVFYIKSEISSAMTSLYVDHSLEKYKIDNPP